MSNISPYPGIYKSDLVQKDECDLARALAVKADISANGEVPDRSGEIIYSTCILNGKLTGDTVCLYGPSPEEFFKTDGEVVMEVVYKNKRGDSFLGKITVPVYSHFKSVLPQNSSMLLDGGALIPGKVMAEIRNIAKEWARLHYPRLAYRRKIYSSLMNVITPKNDEVINEMVKAAWGEAWGGSAKVDPGV